MNTRMAMTIGLLTVLLGCGKSGNAPTQPTPTEDWSFPANGTKVGVTLYAPSQTVSAGGSFEVRFVCYNLTQVFGAATELAYSSDKVDILQVLGGPYLSPDTALVSINKIDPVGGLVSYGATFKAGSGRAGSGSGVLFKLKCKATASGTAAFTVNVQKLSLQKSDGTPIPQFSTMGVENVNITVQ